MEYKGIAFIYDIELTNDSRAQKEIAALSNQGYTIYFCGWNKAITGKNIKENIKIRGNKIISEHICVKVKKRKGFKENAKYLLQFEWRLFIWLVKKQKEYSYIHACNMDTVIIAIIVAKLFHKKVIYDIYDDFADCHVCGEKMYRLLKKIDKYVIESADAVIICSEKRKEQLISLPKNLFIIHNSPDIKKINSELINVNNNPKMKIVYVGNLTEGRMIKEMALIISKYSEWEFYCGGSGEQEKEIKKIANEYENIFFLGRLSYEKVLALESQCDVIPAIYDPSFKNHYYAAPNKFYESLYLGKPTIMIENTGMDWFVEKNNTGIVTQYSQNHVENTFLCLFQKLNYWRSREKEIQKYYYQYFCWDIMEKRLVSLYNNI